MDIYDQLKSATSGVSAYVVLDDENNRLVARVVFTYSRTGTRTTCYLHILGLKMVRAFANGGGYDKHTASIHSAMQKVERGGDASEESKRYAHRFAVTIKDEGAHWDGELSRAGFRVIQAV